MQGPSEGDELSQLAPNLRAAARAPSPANTAALREYIKVLGEKPANLQAASTVPHKPRTGSGRRPQRRYFTIKWRPDDADGSQPAAEAAAVPLDPEALKDAILEQARAERQALLDAVWRPGSGRQPRRREFTVTCPPLPPEEDLEAAAAEAAAAEAVAAEAAEAAAAEAAEEAEEAALAAQVEAEALAAEAAEQLLEYAEEQQWEEEEGVLAEARQQARLQPADASAGTPATALLQQDGQPAGTTNRQQQQTSQRGQARTPGASLFGRYTPMEGVPERLAALAASRGKLLPATLLRSGGPRAAAASTPAGFTPLEGIPERLGALRQLPGGPRLLSLPGATRICSNEAEASVDSPVEGLVQQGAKGSRGSGDGASPADGEAEFAGFAPQPSPQAQQEQEQQQGEQQHDDYDDDVGGFADDGGYQGEPSPGGGSAGGFPFLADGGSPRHMADAGVQTGTSLQLEAAAAEAAAAAAEEPLPDSGNDDGGYDAGGDFGGMDDYEQPDAELPETSAAAQRRGKKRVPGNPGVRLRNELKRKSLAVDPRMGRHEVVPGVRRSCRQKQEPLKWWLNEKKEFGRNHKTMPTVQNVVHKTPNTPWQMVSDIRPRRAAKKQRAPTPHDLEDVLAAEAEAEAAEEEELQQEEEAVAEEEQEEEQQQQQQEEEEEQQQQQEEEEEEPRPARQQRASRTQQRRQQPAGSGRQAATRGKAKAAAPAAKGKATKKAAAGKRRGRR